MALLAALAAGFAQPSFAQEGLRQGLFGKHGGSGRHAASPPIARYVSEDGQTFVLDRTQGRPLLKFEDSPEVWALQPMPAPRGDVIYKNDLGEPVLRATRLGGVTLFTDQRPAGAAAALAGDGSPLRLAPLGPQALLERLAQASLRASRAARRPILFEAEATPNSSALIADAATVTSVAVVRMSRRKDGRTMLSQFRKVLLVEGKKASAVIDDQVLRITVSPSQGLAGRPSSDRIIRVAAGS
ncbi:DUF4908 domain-containing protein [Phenylobacterium sp. VNQ135]|uniref:DUF4908 domain-containing protein n=1 Tax=Phenylobacterium sp. VNQ135 TaxID=3400922 RepID=UPI003BFFB9D3